MKPVVSSLVALVISLAPLSAMAKEPAHHHAKTAHVHKADKKAEKAEKSEKTVADKGEKSEKHEKGPMVRVKAGKKDGAHAKTAVHHAKDADMSGAGHHEPSAKDTHGGAIVSASMTTKIEPVKKTDKHEKVADKKAKPVSKDMPKLPAPKASKSGKEGTKKSSEKKSEPAPSSDDGEATRDEELAELVARIRGIHSESAKSAPGEKGADKASDKSAKHVSHTTPAAPVKPCLKEPVEIVRGPEVERFELTKCDGSIAPAALERFSVLIRPGGAARPTIPPAELAKKAGPDIAPGIKRVDPRLLERVQAVADHFGKSGANAKFFVISGYRPASVGSMHSTGRAMDFRIDGVKNEDVVAFCKTINDTGCGFYPNSSFVHMDVREAGTGHTAWIDASGPGETPRYVTQWPPPEPPVATHETHEKKGPLERTGATERVAPGLGGLEEEGEEMLRAKRPTDDGESSVPVDEHPATPTYETP